MSDSRLLPYALADVPRYTSYPTAVQFGALTPAAFEGWLGALDAASNLSLYAHIPFCQQLCCYCGCHTSVPNGYERAARYVSALLSEIAMTAGHVGGPSGRVRHVHFGGGTPSYLTSADLGSVLEAMNRCFGFARDAEIAIEIDPRGISPERAREFAGLGVSRVSFGVQDFDATVQAKINRIQPYQQVAAVIDSFRAAGIAAINFDLMYGLPSQTIASVEKTARLAAGLRPQRIAVFGYAHVPWFKKHQQMIRSEYLPGVETRIAQARAIAAVLAAEGYIAIGLDHFARADDAMVEALRSRSLRRNFQGYTTDAADALIGFGASSISELPQGFGQNARDVKSWAESIAAGRLTVDRGLARSAEDRARAAIIEALMCYLEADPAAIAARFGFGPDSLADAEEKLAPLLRDGLAVREGALVRVPAANRLFLRTVAAAFDQHFTPAANRHAKAV